MNGGDRRASPMRAVVARQPQKAGVWCRMAFIAAEERSPMRNSHALSRARLTALAAPGATPMAATAAWGTGLSGRARLAHPAVTNVARAAAQQAWLGFEARMAARQHSRTTPLTAPQAATAPTSAFSKITNVESVSRDTLPSTDGAEPDTQTEPDVAVDPSNPQVIIAAAQQGRYVDGGSVDPGYATSQDGGRSWAAGNLPLRTTTGRGPFHPAPDRAAALCPRRPAYSQNRPVRASRPPTACAA